MTIKTIDYMQTTFKKDKKITLVQPRHIYAPAPKEEKLGHIYMPTSLIAAAATLIDAGLDVSIVDENIDIYALRQNVIGINLLGAPYIPIGINYVDSLRKKYGKQFLLIIGGQVVSGLNENQFTKLFSLNAVNGNNIDALSGHFNLEKDTFKKVEDISLIPAFLKLSDKYMKLYLNSEFSFYLSQGCKYSCSFCSAARGLYDPNTKKLIKKSKEIYRNLDIALQDLDFLINKAKSLGITKLRLYLSNLDLFQTPVLLNEFAQSVINLKKKHGDFEIALRGLSTVRSFLRTRRLFPKAISTMVEAGLYRVGFGVDGATPRIWKETRKPQTKSECIKAIHVAKEVYGLTPEILMVFGYNKSEDRISLQLAYEFSKNMYYKYRAIPRPHVAKEIVPGNDGWRDKKNVNIVNYFIDHPVLFQNLDFTALPSPCTHPDKNFRKLVSEYYLKICSLSQSLTQYVKPISLNKNDLPKINKFNLKRYDI